MSFTNQKVVNICPVNIIKIYFLCTQKVPNPVLHFVLKKNVNKEFNLSFHPNVSDSCRKCDTSSIQIKAANTKADVQHLKQELEFALKKHN